MGLILFTGQVHTLDVQCNWYDNDEEEANDGAIEHDQNGDGNATEADDQPCQYGRCHIYHIFEGDFLALRVTPDREKPLPMIVG